eukprot:EC720290.1.p2 GENE.EC720290.1~~EC720290.1.p2  ORF type:complete len:133 (+),score=41.48 EC720290.1:34-432(+)
MSADLIWQVVRNHNSFVLKQGNAVFSREPTNILNVHAQKYSGIANEKAAGIRSSAKGFVLVTKKSSKRSRPAALAVERKIRKQPSRAARVIRAELGAKHYRPDLVQAATRRVFKLHKANVAIKAQKAAADKK